MTALDLAARLLSGAKRRGDFSCLDNALAYARQRPALPAGRARETRRAMLHPCSEVSPAAQARAVAADVNRR